jgi:hypothetical protein
VTGYNIQIKLYATAGYVVLQDVRMFAEKQKQINTTAVYLTKHNLLHISQHLHA